MMPAPRTVTLERFGVIPVRVNGKHHCGAPSSVVPFDEDRPGDGGTVVVKYTVRLTGTADSLDGNGFLVDQEALHALMLDIGSDPVPWREPCELLAFVWARRILTWLSVTNLKLAIQSFDLTLSPAPHAGAFTAHFDTSSLSGARAIPAVRLV